MTHLIKVRGYFYYNRRVPEHVSKFDIRDTIRVSLKTDSKAIAKQRAGIFNEQVSFIVQNNIILKKLI